MFRKPIVAENGMSLIELVIATGLSSILLFAGFEVIRLSSQVTDRINDKFESIQFRNELKQKLKDGKVCTRILTSAGPWITSAVPVSFDASLIGTATPPAIELEQILNDPNPALGVFIAKNGFVGNPLRSIKVRKIELRDIVGTDPNYTARLYVEFERTGQVSIRPIFVTATLTATGAGATKTVINCTDVSKPSRLASEIRDILNSGSFTVPADVYQVRVSVTGAGGGGASGAPANAVGNTCLGGGGGGGGGTAICSVSVNPGQVVPVTVGLGGVSGGGVTGLGSANGGDGQDSSFGAACVGNGGRGGILGISAPSVAISTLSAGGVGGLGSGSNFNDLIIQGEKGPDGPILESCMDPLSFTRSRNIYGLQFGGSSLRGFSIGQGGRGGNSGGGWLYLDSTAGAGKAGAILIEYLKP
jgi:hypothetical protein